VRADVLDKSRASERVRADALRRQIEVAVRRKTLKY
jgi:hypothetical protein